MKVYLVSLAVGVLVGVIYGLLNVRSPAPPVVALVGLLGILLGEQVVPIAKHMLAGAAPHVAWRQSRCTDHVFGQLPGRQADVAAQTPESHS